MAPHGELPQHANEVGRVRAGRRGHGGWGDVSGPTPTRRLEGKGIDTPGCESEWVRCEAGYVDGDARSTEPRSMQLGRSVHTRQRGTID